MERDTWDTAEAIRIVWKHSGYELTLRQLQAWDRNGVVIAERRGEKRKRLYSFQAIRRLCIIAKLLEARFPAQRLREVVRNIDDAAKTVGKTWDMLRLATDGQSVFVIDGDKGINAIGGQLVSLVLLGDLEKKVKRLCRDERGRKSAA